ncbi:hypothetical protein U879_13965 [Defluviimonas sp. 20V17]|uniref:Uncharacterized protein n=1 Tax=Allgaiera indica TaxID=765699 RepID=A0AAN4ZYS6_9RHOB|nr:hypothetical protein [Allgaiera indica]KDB03098.1 hypothetical protein U879_13965 [Defluviimonas sp. 20V17]GHE00807.1 hypothetical protein GCM10008024_13770 [Allgaiera indica]SDW71613.1 hypothetical protein SAMN05444006_10667 [Allgaiera indica]
MVRAGAIHEASIEAAGRAARREEPELPFRRFLAGQHAPRPLAHEGDNVIGEGGAEWLSDLARHLAELPL